MSIFSVPPANSQAQGPRADDLPQEAEAAVFVRDHMKKPVLAYIAGLTAPKGRTMGHAGAIVTSVGESAAEKVEILREAGIGIIVRPSEFGNAVAEALSKL